MTNNKKFFIKVFVAITIFFTVLLGVMIFLHELYQSNFRHQNEIDCFAGAAVKCGNANQTKKEIIEEIIYLNFSLEEAEAVILEAQSEGIKYHNNLRLKDILSEHEKYILDNEWRREEYFERVLEVIDEMKNK